MNYIESSLEIKNLKLQYKQYMRSHQHSIALIYINKILEKIQGHPHISISNKLRQQWCRCHTKIALDHWENGKFLESVKHWKQILLQDETHGSSPYYYIGMNHWLNNENTKAVDYIMKAIMLKPEIINYRKHLKGIIVHMKMTNEDSFDARLICTKINLCAFFECGETTPEECYELCHKSGLFMPLQFDLSATLHAISKGSAYWCQLYSIIQDL